MGGGIDLLEIALKIPPWEPMRQLSRDELRNMKVVTAGEYPDTTSSVSVSSASLSNGTRIAVNGRAWSVVSGDERPALARTHPLTVEGEDIGVFELHLACGETARDYAVTYSERRRADADGRPAAGLTEVGVTLAGKSIALKVLSSRPAEKSAELISVATGRVPADLVQFFADRNGRSMSVETVSAGASTVIRVGNAGIGRVLSALSSGCAAPAARLRNSARTAARQGG